jgi:hypothetical protein
MSSRHTDVSCSVCPIPHARGLAQASAQPLGRRVLLDDAADALLVLALILLEQAVGLGLRGRVGVGRVEQLLDADEDLLDVDSWLPGLLFVQD